MTVWRKNDDGSLNASSGDVYFHLERNGSFWRLSCTENDFTGLFSSEEEAKLYAEDIVSNGGA